MSELNEFQKRIGVGEKQNRYGRYAGTEHKEAIIREDNGKLGGVYTHKWDGSKDCTVFPERKELIKDSKTGDVTIA